MAVLRDDGTDENIIDVETLLQFSDDSTRKAAFEYYWKKLETAPSSCIDLDALRLCVRLLSSQQDDLLYGQLRELIVTRLPVVSSIAERQCLLAEICLGNAQLAHGLFSTLTRHIVQRTISAQSDGPETREQDDSIAPINDYNIVAYLKFIKSAFWLPPAQQYFVTPDLLDAVVSCVGIHDLDECAHDALSALISCQANPAVLLDDQEGLPANPADTSSIVSKSIIDNSLFTRYEQLPSEYFTANAGPAFRTWFQWVTHAATNGIQVDSAHSSFYWSTLRTGLLSGFADQRKYCLGILRQSLLLPNRSINTSIMQLDVDNRPAYISQYDRFSTLFETIVLDRYANQVQACLPELTALFGPESLISPSWATALLSAALDSKVQDGIRKLVGNWYLEYIVSGQGPVVAHVEFFVEGFLSWATQGHLFTSSLTSSRSATSCTHGESLAKAVAKLFAVVQVDLDSRKVLSDILNYILDTGGKIFAPSVLYLLEGLISGVKLQPTLLVESEIQLVLRISRLPSFPEIAADLLTVYCAELCDYVDPESLHLQKVPGYEVFRAKHNVLEKNKPTGTRTPLGPPHISEMGNPLKDFINRLHQSQHKMVQNALFGPACGELLTIFESKPTAVLPGELFEVLDALWEEADRLEYPRSVIINIPAVFFHIICIKVCVQSHSDGSHPSSLAALLQKVLHHMQRLTEGRSYLLSALGSSLRKACFLEPRILTVLPLENFLVQFVNNPPLPRKEFLFEVVAAQNLETSFPHRNYTSYYGQREWHGYAAIIDVLTRFPMSQKEVAKKVLVRILEPWKSQEPPIPIISKWKNVLQLQIMLLLMETCVSDNNADAYLDAFMHALIHEQWPRYRFLLEWTIARIYYRFPSRTERILTDLAKLNENSPVHIASLMKLALLAAPFLNSEEFALKLMIQLIPFSASPKVQVRHEAHWSFPTIFSLAQERGWRTVTDNPAFQALNCHVRGLDKFVTPPLTIRTMKLDAVKDFTLINIFQGQYLSIETPELERVAYEDFELLSANDQMHLSGLVIPPARVPLGDPAALGGGSEITEEQKSGTAATEEVADANPVFFQTKSGFNIASLLLSQGPPRAQQRRPASVILIASLIDNPTNLGGLSRISESFGLEALYIDDLKKNGHKDFKATSVTSEKHLPIRELKAPAIPDFLISMKGQGYEVVGIEQTDRSGMLGVEQGGKGVGTLPMKCVLVLGSERGGITSEVLAAVDRCVEIKTVGVTRSLNVQTAGGIAVYEWWREWGRK